MIKTSRGKTLAGVAAAALAAGMGTPDMAALSVGGKPIERLEQIRAAYLATLAAPEGGAAPDGGVLTALSTAVGSDEAGGTQPDGDVRTAQLWQNFWNNWNNWQNVWQNY